jgi:TolB-like protein/Tfp pilus assembly protein PilF
MKDRPQHVYEFNGFRIYTQQRRLLRNEKVIPLIPKLYDLLLLFIRNPGQLLLREEIKATLWQNKKDVTTNSVDKYVSMLRKALNPGKHTRFQYIVTVPKRGYSFEGRVTEKGKRVEIAVLPFKAATAGQIERELGLGMSEGLTVRLSRLDQINVRPTSAIQKYTAVDQDPVLAGKELKVNYVVDGRVQKERDRIRVTVQLIDVEGKEQLWGDAFDETFTGVFEVQDSISSKVVDSLRLRLTGRERKILARHLTENVKAYQLYKRGRYYWNIRTPEQIKKAITYFERAAKLDPKYALPYAGIADCYVLLSSLGTQVLKPTTGMPKAELAAKKALRLDNTIAEAHTSLAAVLSLYDWNWLAAEREFKSAILHNPNYATARHWFANTLAAAGHIDRALAEVRRAQEADPVSPAVASAPGWILYFAKKYDEAIDVCNEALEMNEANLLSHAFIGLSLRQKSQFSAAIRSFKIGLALDNNNPPLLAELGQTYALSGMRQEANAILRKLQSMARQQYVSPYNIAKVFLGLGRDREFFQYLESAYEHRSGGMIFLNVEPAFDRIRSDSRFTRLVNRVGFGEWP